MNPFIEQKMVADISKLMSMKIKSNETCISEPKTTSKKIESKNETQIGHYTTTE